MIPRADIVSVGMAESFADIIRQMSEANHSRVPVRRQTLDEIAGFIHIKDVFAHLPAGDAPEVESLLRPALFVAPTIRLLDLLHEMRLRRRHLALVVDEFGGVDGLITIEDLVEQIVGEIEDEHDKPSTPRFEVNDDGTTVAEARLEIEELERLWSANCLRMMIVTKLTRLVDLFAPLLAAFQDVARWSAILRACSSRFWRVIHAVSPC